MAQTAFFKAILKEILENEIFTNFKRLNSFISNTQPCQFQSIVTKYI